MNVWPWKLFLPAFSPERPFTQMWVSTPSCTSTADTAVPAKEVQESPAGDYRAPGRI